MTRVAFPIIVFRLTTIFPIHKLLLTLWLTIEDHDTLFVLAELAHFLGIVILVYKLHRKKSVAGAQSLSTGCTAGYSC